MVVSNNKSVNIDPEAPDSKIIASGASTLSNGGVVLFPTQGLYGLAANAWNKTAVERIFTMKNRPPEKPLLVLIGDHADVPMLAQSVPETAQRIMHHCWPGGVTLVFQARSELSEALTAGSGKIGIRLPLHPVARALVRAANRPITGTSANISGQPGCADLSGVDPRITKQVDLILDAGRLKGGPGSTVVDVTCDPPRILRPGIIPAKRIDLALKNRHFPIDNPK